MGLTGQPLSLRAADIPNEAHFTARHFRMVRTQGGCHYFQRPLKKLPGLILLDYILITL